MNNLSKLRRILRYPDNQESLNALTAQVIAAATIDPSVYSTIRGLIGDWESSKAALVHDLAQPTFYKVECPSDIPGVRAMRHREQMRAISREIACLLRVPMEVGNGKPF